MKRFTTHLKLAIPCLGALACTFGSLQAAPHVVPGIKSWSATSGTLKADTSRIFVNPKDATHLEPIAQILATELGEGSQIVKSDKLAKRSVYLKLDSSLKEAEGYKMVIATDGVIISGQSRTGVFYGTRTLLQMLRQGDLPCGVIEDAPLYPVRSVLLDVGRKFMPVEEVKDWIRMMGWMKLNELHFHLNDNSWGRYPGYRLESKKFPGLASKDGHYTFKQIRELQDFAKLRGVVIIPEIDSPGHSLAFTTYRPELAHPELNRSGFGLAYLDLRNPEAIKFMEDIWDEVCPLFDAPLVHIGTDEYRLSLVRNKKEREALGESFRQYINHLNRYIRKKHGKTVRTWSGYEHMPGKTQPDKNIIIDMWETSDAKTKVNAGYKVVNSSHFYTYIVPGAPYYGVNNGFIYNTWTPMQFSGKPAGMLSPEDPGLMGGKLHVWNDFGPSGYTWNEIARLTLPAMATMGEKLWGAKAAKDYKSFEQYASSLTADIPQVKLTKRNAATDNALVWELKKPKLVIPNNNPELGLASENLEWPWTLNVTLTRHNDVKGDEIFLSSDLAAFYLDLTHREHDKKKKKDIVKRGFACVRANQAYGHEPITSNRPDILVFNYQVPLHKKVKLTIVGERRSTSLYVDGKLVQTIGKQMVCPLTRLGDKLPRGPHATYHEMSIKSKAPTNVKIGSWSSGKVTEATTAVEYDLTQSLKSAGDYHVSFQFASGLHRLDISKVELLEDGKVIHTDEHHGITGGSSQNNVYSLSLGSFKKGAKYSLRASIHSDGGTDSNGTIYLQGMP